MTPGFEDPGASSSDGPRGVPKPRAGGFRLNGQWDPEGSWNTPLGRFTRLLIMGRRFGYHGYPPYKASPSDLALMIRREGYPEAFGNLDLWDQITDRNDWQELFTTTSAGEAVKRCGWGSLPGKWEEGTGRFMPDQAALDRWREEVSRFQPFTPSIVEDVKSEW